MYKWGDPVFSEINRAQSNKSTTGLKLNSQSVYSFICMLICCQLQVFNPFSAILSSQLLINLDFN